MLQYLLPKKMSPVWWTFRAMFKGLRGYIHIQVDILLILMNQVLVVSMLQLVGGDMNTASNAKVSTNKVPVPSGGFGQQDLFHNIFNSHGLCKKLVNSTIYSEHFQYKNNPIEYNMYSKYSTTTTVYELPAKYKCSYSSTCRAHRSNVWEQWSTEYS